MTESEKQSLAELLLGGGAATVGGKAFYDLNKLERLAANWAEESKATAKILNERANTFVSPISGERFQISPADFDLDHKTYYENANKVLNKRLLGFKVGNLYDWHNQFSSALEQMQGVPKDHPVFFDGLLNNSKARTHNQFQMSKHRQDSLAHFLRDYTFKKGKLRDLLFEAKDVESKVPKRLLEWAKKVQTDPGKFKIVTPYVEGKSLPTFMNMLYNSPKGIRLMLANAIAGSGKTTEISPFLKSLGVTNENFSLQTIYDKLVDASKNTVDDAAKKNLVRNIKVFEKIMLGSEWAGRFSNKMGPHYAEALGSTLKNLRPVKYGAGVAGLLGLGVLGHGAYKAISENHFRN